MKKIILLTILFFASFFILKAQETKSKFPYSNRLSVQTGLLQDLALGGQNLVFSYTTNRLVFDWSHGVSLDYAAGKHFKSNDSYNKQKLDVHVPWSTGPSIGYRITPYFNIRAEFKAHHNVVRLEGSKKDVTSYNTYTIGAGAFYEWYPFKKKENWLQGILIEPVVRFWPNVGSSLKNNYTYNNERTGNTETLDSYKLGWLANINVGYTFGRKSK
jgi:hypothetical protein